MSDKKTVPPNEQHQHMLDLEVYIKKVKDKNRENRYTEDVYRAEREEERENNKHDHERY